MGPSSSGRSPSTLLINIDAEFAKHPITEVVFVLRIEKKSFPLLVNDEVVPFRSRHTFRCFENALLEGAHEALLPGIQLALRPEVLLPKLLNFRSCVLNLGLFLRSLLLRVQQLPGFKLLLERPNLLSLLLDFRPPFVLELIEFLLDGGIFGHLIENVLRIDVSNFLLGNAHGGTGPQCSHHEQGDNEPDSPSKGTLETKPIVNKQSNQRPKEVDEETSARRGDVELSSPSLSQRELKGPAGRPVLPRLASQRRKAVKVVPIVELEHADDREKQFDPDTGRAIQVGG